MKSTKELLSALIPLFIAILLSVGVGNFLYQKLNGLREKIASESKIATQLNQKLRILSNYTSTNDDGVDFSTLALPENNASLMAVSQLKVLATENTLIIDSLKVGGEVKDASGMIRSDMVVSVQGLKKDVFNFINSISKVAPLMTADKIKISESLAVTKADITIKSFWAPLPKTIPSITGEVKELTEEEMQVLSLIESLRKPQVLINSESGENTQRQNPFTL